MKKRNQEVRIIKEYKFTIISIILIFIAIIMPGSDVPSVGIPNIDKIVHAGMFGFLSMCYYGEYNSKHKELPHFKRAFPSIFSYASLTELLQLAVPGRSCDIVDLMADAVGMLIIIGVAYKLKDRENKQKNRE